ncbi:MAG: hypothetical protein C0606_00785 [Hyphomicrobiales bacterium]|nr:MAG: hypothetical protein C0606_00785 [Hyphomicrobiales bacterium]
MNDKPETVLSEDDLHAYVDGQLDEERRAEVEAYLAANPQAAAEVADYRRINAALGEAFDGVMDEPIPASHVAAVKARGWRPALPMAAALVGLLMGGGIGWGAHGFAERDPTNLIAASSAAYDVFSVEKRHPVEVAATESDHLQKWLSNRMGMPLSIPRLNDLGFSLVGGRLLVGENAPAALLMYENGEGRRMVLYVRNDLPPARANDFAYARSNETGVVAWSHGNVGFGVAGGFSEKELVPAAHLVRAQLSL